MKRLLLFMVVLGGVWSLAQGQSPVYVTPDVPTTTSGGTTLLPWQIFRYDPIPPTYGLQLTVPGDPHIDAIHKLDKPGEWLFSVETPNNLAGGLAADAQPGDVIRRNGLGVYSICFSAASVGIPAGVNVDTLYMEGGDTGNLVVSFDVPVDLGGFPTFLPGDLVRFTPTVSGVVCPGWALAAANPVLGGIGIPISDNVIGADASGAIRILSFDVPTLLGPPGPVNYTPNQLVSWNGAAFGVFTTLTGWPAGSLVDGLSCLANPGTVSTTITLVKSGANIIVSWPASCSEGAEDYGIYEGTLGTWYSHTMLDCSSASPPPLLSETITPSAGNRYYLVVAKNAKSEGSYGQCSNVAAAAAAGCTPPALERPLAAVVCASPRELTPCPP